jgi:5-methylcytosine-specific restriction enzyme B
VLVIEEINRGNPAQILGELLTLIEDSKRDPAEALRLAYPRSVDERVYVPANLYIIGTMNLADRSLALVDLALRRRFAFLDLGPELGDAWRRWCRRMGAPEPILDRIAGRLGELNKTIADHRALGPQYRVGHSFVTPATSPGHTAEAWVQWFYEVVEREIGPLLREYWYDDGPAVDEQLTRLRHAT